MLIRRPLGVIRRVRSLCPCPLLLSSPWDLGNDIQLPCPPRAETLTSDSDPQMGIPPNGWSTRMGYPPQKMEHRRKLQKTSSFIVRYVRLCAECSMYAPDQPTTCPWSDHQASTNTTIHISSRPLESRRNPKGVFDGNPTKGLEMTKNKSSRDRVLYSGNSQWTSGEYFEPIQKAPNPFW